MVVFFNGTSTTESYPYSHTLSLHDALPIYWSGAVFGANRAGGSCRGAPWRDAYCADRRCAVAVGVEGCPRFVVSVGIQRGGGFAQGAGLVLPYDGGAFGACRAPCCAFRCQGRPGSA